MRGKRAIGGGRRSLRRVLFQAALVAARHNSNLETVARHLREKGKPHKVSVVAIARRLVVMANANANANVIANVIANANANAILKAAVPWTLQDPA